MATATTMYVDEDEICCLCFDEVEDGHTYYCPPCGHLYCYLCMDQHELLNRCTRCNQNFMVASPVKVRTVIDVDATEPVIDVDAPNAVPEPEGDVIDMLAED